VFYFASGPIFSLTILILLRKLEKELILYVQDVIEYWIKGVQPHSHVAGPSCNLWSFHKSKGKSDFLDRGIVTSYVLVKSEISFYFFDKVVGKKAVSGKDLW